MQCIAFHHLHFVAGNTVELHQPVPAVPRCVAAHWTKTYHCTSLCTGLCTLLAYNDYAQHPEQRLWAACQADDALIPSNLWFVRQTSNICHSDKAKVCQSKSRQVYRPCTIHKGMSDSSARFRLLPCMAVAAHCQ